jgi:hypothetical protein
VAMRSGVADDFQELDLPGGSNKTTLLSD